MYDKESYEEVILDALEDSISYLKKLNEQDSKKSFLN